MLSDVIAGNADRSSAVRTGFGCRRAGLS